MRLNAAVLPIFTVALLGCGSSDDGSRDGVKNGQDPGDPSSEWQTLVSGEWTMPAGTEGYVCVRKTVKEDLFVSAFDAMLPVGTHHTLLGVGAPDAPDGVSPCTSTTVFRTSAYGGGVRMDPLIFPKGIARKIPKGSQLLLNLHLFNGYGEDLTGTSGARVLTIPESEVVALTEHVAAGPQQFQLPARETTTLTGHCTMTSDVTLIAVAPHMHRLGTHQKVVAETAAGDVTLLDSPYSFDNQSYTSLEPVKLSRGERVRVECTYNNTTDAVVESGDSTLDEMCAGAIYRYPADNTFWVCNN